MAPSPSPNAGAGDAVPVTGTKVNCYYDPAIREERKTELLERATKAIQELPDAEQDAIAALILEEIAGEQARDEAFARSQDKLAQIADKVRVGIQAGRVRDCANG